MFINHFNLEEFAKPVPSGYLISRKDTNILNYICQELSHKIEITKYIVSSVKKREKSSFPTHSHVKWAMECLGFAFSLPVDQYNIISQAIEIYRNWLDIGNEGRPQCIEENEGFYQREIIGHMSLLFIERNGDMHRHAELCRDVLLLIKDLCRWKNMEKETWHHLLKIFLMLTSGLLKNNTILSKEIGPLLLKTLFEAWFRSNTREIELWEELKNFTATWLNNIWVIYHWISVESGLTKSVIDLVYGVTKPKLRVTFKQLPKPFEIESELISISCGKEQIIYFWYQFLQIITKNTAQKIPEDSAICTELVKSFAILTDDFINFSKYRNSKAKVDFSYNESTGNTELDSLLLNFQEVHLKFVNGEARVPVPRINSILALFGNWLFTYANCDYIYCERGRAKAIGALCRIFSSNLGPVSEENAGKFYKTLGNSLKAGVSPIVIKSIVKNSTNLLACNFPGIHILLDKDYLIKAVFFQYNNTEKDDSQTKGFIYDTIACFVACINLTNNNDIVKNLFDLLLNAVQTENNEKNFNKVIWVVCTFVVSIQNQYELVHNIIVALANRLKNISNENIYLSLMCVLATLPFLIFNKTQLKPTALTVLNKLSTYIKKKYQNASESIINSLLLCIRKWLICFPLVILDNLLRHTLLEILVCTKLVGHLAEISMYMEDFITCRVGVIHELSEDLKNNQITMPRGLFSHQSQNYKNYMTFNNTLISLHGTQSGVIGIFRNKIGKSIWKAHSVYSNSACFKELVWKMDLVSSDTCRTVANSPNDLEEILEEQEKNDFRKIQSLQLKQQRLNRPKAKNRSMKSLEWPEPAQIECSRLFLAHLGFLDYEQIENITQVHSELANPNITSLDTFAENEVYFLPILYIDSSSSLDFLGTSECFSQNFFTFLEQLGFVLDSRHLDLGFLAHLKIALEKFKSLLYYSDGLHDILSVIPCFSKGVNTLQDITGASPVVVIWNERIDDKHCIFQPSVLQQPEMEHKICVLLTPMQKKLVKINFYPTTSQPGPLIDNMILPLSILGKFLQYTLINIYGDSLEAVTSHKNRQDLLEQLNLLGKNEDSASKCMDKILNYSFNLDRVV